MEKNRGGETKTKRKPVTFYGFYVSYQVKVFVRYAIHAGHTAYSSVGPMVQQEYIKTTIN